MTRTGIHNEGAEKMTGIERIAAERTRQIDVEGWTPEHDDGHGGGDLSGAASDYANLASQIAFEGSADFYDCGHVPASWPWDPKWWKPSEDPIRNLEKAGALIAAEIDRLLRARGEAP